MLDETLSDDDDETMAGEIVPNGGYMQLRSQIHVINNSKQKLEKDQRNSLSTNNDWSLIRKKSMFNYSPHYKLSGKRLQFWKKRIKFILME